ncbi:MAG TPA: hypothetical protein VNS32_12475 [Flavisolibacter sp.]|nr:hypothetical protein [Flavisolibacter sp.]
MTPNEQTSHGAHADLSESRPGFSHFQETTDLQWRIYMLFFKVCFDRKYTSTSMAGLAILRFILWYNQQLMTKRKSDTDMATYKAVINRAILITAPVAG